ncbi:MAG: extracellular solute-binding protein [Acidimicrobiaceae bacterium]|nr:extracellular solute-binding protein [Acidimicrobiaceae bacterium]
MGRKLKVVGVGAVVAAVALLAAGCGTTGSTAAGGAHTITLYNGQHQQTTQALVAAFERQTGIAVKERDGDEDALAEQIEQEGSGSPADVIYTENSLALQNLDSHGLLAPVSPSTLSVTPSQYNSPNGNWVGVSARVSALVYNTGKASASQMPTSVMDLANPKWKGKLALAPTETDFLPIISSIAKAKGKAAALSWLNAVKANASSHIYPDNETVTADVNAGQAELGLINGYYWFRLRAEIGSKKIHSALAFFAPRDPGYVVDVSGAGLLKSSKHQADAQKFLAFLVSKQGQQILAHSDSFEYPLTPGVAPAPGLQPFAQLQPAPISVADLGDGSEALQLLQEAQLA